METITLEELLNDALGLANSLSARQLNRNESSITLLYRPCGSRWDVEVTWADNSKLCLSSEDPRKAVEMLVDSLIEILEVTAKSKQ